MRVIDLRRQDFGLHGIGGVLAHRGQHRFGRGLHGGDIARMDFEIAELAFDDENAALHVGLLQGDVGQRFDVEARAPPR